MPKTLPELLQQHGVDECRIGVNGAGDFVLLVPSGTEDDPDTDAYFIDNLQGDLRTPGGE